jgi:hypothetical protein
MRDVVITKVNVNIEAVDAALRAALGATSSGVSASGDEVVVHLDDAATPTQIQQAQQIVASHDPQVLTPEQQAEANRRQALKQAQQAAEALPLSPSDFTGKQQALAQKVLWLEQAVRDLQQRLGVQ